MDNIKEKYSILSGETKENETARIRLACEPWNDIMYSYGVINVDEDENEKCFLHYEFTVHDPEDFDLQLYSEEEQEQFKNLLGDIIVDLIMESIADVREDDTGEFVTE